MEDIGANESDGTPIDPLAAFLREGEYTIRHPGVYCKYSEFHFDFKDYCQSNGLTYTRLGKKGTKQAFGQYHLKIERCNNRSYPVGSCIECVGNWVVGLCKADVGSIVPEYIERVLSRNTPSTRVEDAARAIAAEAMLTMANSSAVTGHSPLPLSKIWPTTGAAKKQSGP